VKATTHFDDPKAVLEAHEELGEAMRGLMCANSKKRIFYRRAMVSTHRGQGIQAMKIGILAVQGDFAAHAAMLAGMGVETVEVRAPEDLANCERG